MAHRSSLFYFDSAEKHVKRGILTIYTNHPSENLVQKHKTIKFDVVGELPTKRYTQNKVSPRRSIPKSAEQTKKSRKIASTQITCHIFFSFPNEVVRTIWFSNRISVFPMQMASTLRLPLNSKMIQQMRYWFDCPKKSTEIFCLHLLAMTLRGFSIKYTMVSLMASQSNAARWRSRWRRTYIFSSFSKENVKVMKILTA